MSFESNEILSKALSLSPLDRAEIVERLLSSFEFSSRTEIDAHWATEAEDRISAYERGDIQTHSVKKVFERIDQKI